jgi:hypothetical protein
MKTKVFAALSTMTLFSYLIAPIPDPFEQQFLANTQAVYEQTTQELGLTAQRKTVHTKRQRTQNIFPHIMDPLITRVCDQLEFETFQREDMHDFLIVAMALKHGPPYTPCAQPEQAALLFKAVIRVSDSISLHGIAQRSVKSCD